MGVWKVLGYNMVLLLVGLRNIPAISLRGRGHRRRRAAGGCSARSRLPLLKPILLFVIVVSTINAYNVFTQVYVMTQGSQAAPGHAAARAGLRHLPERLPVLQDGLRLGGGRGAHASSSSASRWSSSASSASTRAERMPVDGARGDLVAPRRHAAPRRTRVLMAGCVVMLFPYPLDGGHVLQAAGRDRSLWPPRILPDPLDLGELSAAHRGGALRPLLRQQPRSSRGLHPDASSLTSLLAGFIFGKYQLPGQEAPLHRDPRHRDVAVRDAT